MIWNISVATIFNFNAAKYSAQHMRAWKVVGQTRIIGYKGQLLFTSITYFYLFLFIFCKGLHSEGGLLIKWRLTLSGKLVHK